LSHAWSARNNPLAGKTKSENDGGRENFSASFFYDLGLVEAADPAINKQGLFR
jgi:hypothetical protein